MKPAMNFAILSVILTPLVGGASGQTPLTEPEKAGLTFMREEEKLAFDVYTALAQKWGDRPFANIARAEQTHMQAVGNLMARYGIPDPIAGAKPGVFVNKDLQTLHDKLVLRGSTSRLEALKVGVEIEELDVYDLRRWIDQTKNQDILLVFRNLERGSRNHLRSFMQGVTRSGGTYTPTHLSRAEFDKIITSPMERGRGGW